MRVVFAAVALLLFGCSNDETRMPSIEVTTRSFDLEVPARGELIAAESMPVALHGGVRKGFVIDWMAPEFSAVKKGDVVARLEDTQI